MTNKPAKRNRRKRQIYSGALSKPGHNRLRWPVKEILKTDTFYGQRSPDLIKNFIEELISTEEENLLLLMDHYGIERDLENRWRILAFALARDHVPAFKAPPARGRPKKNTDMMRVFFQVKKKMVDNPALSESRAISIVKKNHYPEVSEKTVADWFYKASPEAEKLFEETKELDKLHSDWVMNEKPQPTEEPQD